MLGGITIEAKKIKIGFMHGNLDHQGQIFEEVSNFYSQKEMYESFFMNDDAVYSNGFVRAIEAGMIPELKLNKTNSYSLHSDLEEYHHVIINNECFNVYFKEA